MNDEKLQRWASIAEIAAAVAVIFSVLYLAIEITNNTRALQASSRQDFAALDVSLVTAGIDSAVLAVALTKKDAGEELSPLEEDQILRNQQLFLRIVENAYYQYRIGLTLESDWDRYLEYLNRRLCNDQYTIIVSKVAYFPIEFSSLMDDVRSSCQ